MLVIAAAVARNAWARQMAALSAHVVAYVPMMKTTFGAT